MKEKTFSPRSLSKDENLRVLALLPNIKTANDITHDAIKDIRLALKISMREFWEGMGYTYTWGSIVEKGLKPLSAETKRYVFLKYIAFLPVDVFTEEEAYKAKRLGELNKS